MTVAILILVILRDGLSPRGTSFKLDVVDIDSCVDDVDINTTTSNFVVGVLVESAEAELIPVADTGKTLIAEMN